MCAHYSALKNLLSLLPPSIFSLNLSPIQNLFKGKPWRWLLECTVSYVTQKLCVFQSFSPLYSIHPLRTQIIRQQKSLVFCQRQLLFHGWELRGTTALPLPAVHSSRPCWTIGKCGWRNLVPSSASDGPNGKKWEKVNRATNCASI